MNMSYSLGSKVRLFGLYAPIISGVRADKNVRKEFVNRWMAPGMKKHQYSGYSKSFQPGL